MISRRKERPGRVQSLWEALLQVQSVDCNPISGCFGKWSLKQKMMTVIHMPSLMLLASVRSCASCSCRLAMSSTRQSSTSELHAVSAVLSLAT